MAQPKVSDEDRVPTSGGHLRKWYADLGRDEYIHIYVWEQFWGFRVPDGFVIHHIDFNPRNNAIENLQLMTRSAHTKIHGMEPWKFRKAYIAIHGYPVSA